MKTDELIDKLCSEHTKVTPMCTWRCALGWVLFVGVFMYFATGGYGMRSDLFDFLDTPLCRLELYLAGATGLIAALAASWLSTPDCKQQRWMFWMPFLPLSGLIGVVAYGLYKDMEVGQMEMTDQKHCLTSMLLFVVVPSVIFYAILRRAATTRPCWTASMAAIAVGSFAYIAMRLVCEMTLRLDVVVWTVLPLTVAGFILALLGGKWLKW